MLEKGPCIGGVLWGSTAHSPMVTRAICSRGAFYVGSIHPSVVARLTAMGILVGGTGPQPSWLKGPASCGGCRPTGGNSRFSMWLAAWPRSGEHRVAAGHWWVRLGPHATVCVDTVLGVLSTGAGLLPPSQCLGLLTSS